MSTSPIIYALSPSTSTLVPSRENSPKNSIARVYDSDRRNTYCQEYDDYKRCIINLRTMYPNSPFVELEFEEWVTIRIEKVEDSRQVLKLKLNTAIEKVIKGGNTHQVANHLALLAARDAATWPFADNLSFAPSNPKFGPEVWENCRVIWSQDESDNSWARIVRRPTTTIATDDSSSLPSTPSTAVTFMTEPFITAHSIATSVFPPGPFSLSIKTARHFNYNLRNGASMQSRPLYNGRIPFLQAQELAVESRVACLSGKHESNMFGNGGVVGC